MIEDIKGIKDKTKEETKYGAREEIRASKICCCLLHYCYFFAEGVDGLLLVYLPLVNYIVKLIRNSNKQTLNLNYLQTKLLHSCKLRPIMLSVSQDLYFINVTCNDPVIS